MTSEEIILNAYKREHLTLEESLQLLKDIKHQSWVYPYYPQITYTCQDGTNIVPKNIDAPDFTVTCSYD